MGVACGEVKRVAMRALLDDSPDTPRESSFGRRKLAAILHAERGRVQPPDG